MKKMPRIRCYGELRRLRTHEERFEYLKLKSQVGLATFGFERYLNQAFYTSTQWKHVRNVVIARDNGCDLGVPDHEIYDRVIIHHMNPMSVDAVVHGDERILDPEYLVCVSHNTHNAIHYGDKSLLIKPIVERRPGDTKLWLGGRQ
jgi:hypothetical protein